MTRGQPVVTTPIGAVVPQNWTSKRRKPHFVAISHRLETEPLWIDYRAIYCGEEHETGDEVFRAALDLIRQQFPGLSGVLERNLLIMPYDLIMNGQYPRAQADLLDQEQGMSVY